MEAKQTTLQPVIDKWSSILEKVSFERDYFSFTRAEKTAYDAIVKKNVKAILGFYFPGANFKISLSHQLYKDSVKISWIDGPILSDVENVGELSYFIEYGYQNDNLSDYGDFVKISEGETWRKTFGSFCGHIDHIDFYRNLSDTASNYANEFVSGIFKNWNKNERFPLTADEWRTFCGKLNIDRQLVYNCYKQSVDASGRQCFEVAPVVILEILAEALQVQDAKTYDKEPAEMDEGPAEGLTLEYMEGGVFIAGDSRTTYKNRHAIKSHGAKWNKTAQRWEATTDASVQELIKWFGVSADAASAQTDTTDATTGTPDETPGAPDETTKEILDLISYFKEFAKALFNAASEAEKYNNVPIPEEVLYKWIERRKKGFSLCSIMCEICAYLAGLFADDDKKVINGFGQLFYMLCKNDALAAQIQAPTVAEVVAFIRNKHFDRIADVIDKIAA